MKNIFMYYTKKIGPDKIDHAPVFDQVILERIAC